MSQEIKYITIWDSAWQNEFVNRDQFLDEVSSCGVNTIAFDIRWNLHEQHEHQYESATTAGRCFGEPSAETLASQVEEMRHRINGLHEKLQSQGERKRNLRQ